MKNGLRYIFMFAVGAAIGSAVTWKLVKTKYEKIAQEEIDSVKEVFSKKEVPIEKDNDGPSEEEDFDAYLRHKHPEIAFEEDGLPSMDYYKELVKKYDKNKDKEVDKVSMYSEIPPDVVIPEVIPPDEFGDDPDYDTISLTYYADGILTDDMDCIIENVDDVVGIESLDCFGEWEDDCVYVRNDNYKSYYEILRDMRTYKDVVQEGEQCEI